MSYKQALVCVHGNVEIGFYKQKSVVLNCPDQVLILEPDEYHYMQNFSKDAVLLVLSSEFYNPDDYVYEA